MDRKELEMKNKLDGRSYDHRIGKPYYGHALKRVIATEAPPESIIERMNLWWIELSFKEALFVTVVVVFAVLGALVIVAL
jgi:hypothetical protein